MDYLFPISAFLNFVLLSTLAVGLIFYQRRSGRLAELEHLLKDAGNEAAAARRKHVAERERANDLEASIADLRKESKRQTTVAEDREKALRAEIEAAQRALAAAEEGSGDTFVRLRDAEARNNRLEVEAARLRTDATQAIKRAETADAAAEDYRDRFQKTEAALEAKEAALLEKRNECADRERELREACASLAEVTSARDRHAAAEAALTKRLEAAEEARRAGDRETQRLNEELAEALLSLREVQAELGALRESLAAGAAAGTEAEQQRLALEEKIAALSGKLARREAALSDLEKAHAAANAETPYVAHRHMQWTLNHFDPRSITFKFQNEGAEVYLVGVETDVPDLTYELETGHGLPREKEARIKLAIAKNAGERLKEMPDEFEMKVLYALHVFPIRFKIRPRQGQRIERIMDGPE